jgi:hypothetical protein
MSTCLWKTDGPCLSITFKKMRRYGFALISRVSTIPPWTPLDSNSCFIVRSFLSRLSLWFLL